MSRILFEFFGDDEIKPSAIASAEAFGTHTLDQTIHFTGIVSAEAFGTANLTQIVQPTGILSGEAFGTLEVQEQFPGPMTGQTLDRTPVPNVRMLLDPSLYPQASTVPRSAIHTPLNSVILMTGIPSEEAFGVQESMTASFVRSQIPVPGGMGARTVF